MDMLMDKEVLMLVLPIVLLLVEWYMGRTDKTESNSLIDLVGELLGKLKK